MFVSPSPAWQSLDGEGHDSHAKPSPAKPSPAEPRLSRSGWLLSSLSLLDQARPRDNFPKPILRGSRVPSIPPIRSGTVVKLGLPGLAARIA